MRKVKLGFAGVGFMGQMAHLQNYVRIPGCEVVAIAEPRRQLAERVARKYDLSPRFYASHEELATDPEVEAVVASQPFLRNGFIASPLLRAGKHVFIEKPMAGSLAEAESMVEAAEAGGAQLMVGFMKRCDSGVNLALDLLEQFVRTGELGPMGLISACCFCGDWLRGIDGALHSDEPIPESGAFVPRYPGWMPENRRAAFETYMNIFSHNINLVRYLCPGHFEVKASAMQPNGLSQVTTLVREGVPVTLHGTGVRAEWWEEKTEVYFEHGWVRVMTASPMDVQASTRVEAYLPGETRKLVQMQGRPVWAFRAQAQHFIECVRQGARPRSHGRDCLEDMRLIEDVFRLAQWL